MRRFRRTVSRESYAVRMDLRFARSREADCRGCLRRCGWWAGFGIVALSGEVLSGEGLCSSCWLPLAGRGGEFDV